MTRGAQRVTAERARRPAAEPAEDGRGGVASAWVEAIHGSPAAQAQNARLAALGAAASTLQRRAVATGDEVYYNGNKALYRLDDHEGEYIRAAVAPRPGFATYRRVEPTGATHANGLRSYRLVNPAQNVELDERSPRQRWIDNVGGGQFGDNYFTLPQTAYPHLSVSYAIEGDRVVFGDAHYSRSHDDSRRLSYVRTAAGWRYAHDVAGPNHDAVKATADGLIARMTGALSL